MKNMITITVINDFSKKPYGRYESDGGSDCGYLFRKNKLVPALKKHEKVHVVLTGYNRYGRSFIDEAFERTIANLSNPTPLPVQYGRPYLNACIKPLSIA